MGVVQFITRYIIKDKIEFQAEHDALTGLYNRYYFFREHDKAIDNFLEQYRNFALLMIDIDKFKDINDTFGHETGDKALQFLAYALHEHCRKNDLAVRYGGEEFIILLQEIDADGAYKIAERIRTFIETNSAEAVVPMTVSIEICLYKKAILHPATLIMPTKLCIMQNKQEEIKQSILMHYKSIILSKTCVI